MIAGLPPIYLARHAETVFNVTGRMQGWHRHTPLTANGIAQAQAMADALRLALGIKPPIDLWCSTAGRAQQTAAVIAEALDVDFFAIRLDDRLQEIDIGSWEGQSYRDLAQIHGPIVDAEHRLIALRPPGGEWYPQIVERLAGWLADIQAAGKPVLAISHGITSRVLRGALVGGRSFGGVLVADEAPQGTVLCIEAGRERIVHLGQGSNGTHRLQGL